uniref:Uncharacterized protein n=1 Tax=Avena sativa TaxID=4498 RepID=A0ACD5TLF5_AVESA
MDRLLKSTICDDYGMRKHFSIIFYVDCSLWKNRRTMQKAIAEELNLHHVMHIFDKQDEEDDFRGVDEISRDEISSIGSLIHETLRNERFLMLFHYGGVEAIDLVECGIPPFSKGKLLWTNCGRFFQFNQTKVKMMPTSSNMEISHWVSPIHANAYLQSILHEEAVGIIGDISMDGIDLETVLDCFMYQLFLTSQLPENSTGVDYGWATHICNYWVCDGILGAEKAWEIGDALYRVMPWLDNSVKKARILSSYFNGRKKSYEGWYSLTCKKREDDIPSVPHSASSYFLTFERANPVYVRSDLFQLANNNLRVLKLCNCTFDFSYPPFQCCHNLRFLWLDHCANTGEKQSGKTIFPNLLVFDIRFTQFVLLPQMIDLMTNLRELNTKGVSWNTMSHALKRLLNLHKLRVTESLDVVTRDSCSSIDMVNLELLDFSGNTCMESLPTFQSSTRLKMLVIDGCSSLEQLALEGAPLLESFSFDGYGPTENWTHSINLPQKKVRLESPIAPVEIIKVTKISLHGCERLRNIFMRALPNLEELDLSGTAIKILDLREMAVPKLKKLFLMGCEKLRHLFWMGPPSLEILHVDTRKTRSTVCNGEQGSFGSEVCIAFTDGRFIWSAVKGLIGCANRGSKVYLLISCMSHSQAKITGCVKEIGSSQNGWVLTSPLLPYDNIALTEDVTVSSLVWNHRQLQTMDVHMEIGEGSYNIESMQEYTYFVSFVRHVQSLHIHDNSSITSIPPTGVAHWDKLEWCHVERCPKLHHLFPCGNGPFNFQHIRIFSASGLPVAYCIWVRGINSTWGRICFLQKLQHIYLYNCPNLVFVLPISFTLPNLETLQIAYCTNLRHVFPLDDKYPKEISSGVSFTKLKHIKLNHLHNLEKICEVRLNAPALQTIGIRECQGLRRLPAVARQGPKPVVDCEEDCWNKLEWDGLSSGHHPSLFETRHSAYYKKPAARVSVLR